MKLSNCPVCERHVRPQDVRCPFCDAGLELVSASRAGPVIVAAMGLALFGCGDDGTTSTTMGGSASMTAGSATATEGVTDDGSSSDPDPTFDTGGNEYAGPGTTFTTLDPTTGGETGTDTGSGTDATTSSTGGSTLTDSGGQDYAGAG